jgi:hypothetical protein
MRKAILNNSKSTVIISLEQRKLSFCHHVVSKGVMLVRLTANKRLGNFENGTRSECMITSRSLSTGLAAGENKYPTSF